MKIGRLILGLVLATGFVFTTGCGDPDARTLEKATGKFGVSMDAQRQTLGIPAIPKGGNASLLGTKTLSWTGDPSRGHMAKTLVYNEDMSAVISETDIFAGEAGMLAVETTYAADGKSISKQVFKVGEKVLSEEKGKALLQTFMKANNAPSAPIHVEEANR